VSVAPAMLPALTLRSVRSTAVEVPLRYVLGTSAVAVRAAPLLLVDVETEQGVTGRSYVFCYRRSGARAVAAVLQEAAELVGGETVAPVAIATPLERRFALIGVTGIVRMALSALDMALWDARWPSPRACHWPPCLAGRRGSLQPTTRADSD
jgi:mandelate racemase